MRIVVQRVRGARVLIDGEQVARIDRGLLALVGVGRDDSVEEADRLAAKLATLRVFPDDDGKMNRAVAEVGGSVLVVPNFTLYGDTRRGRRPSWVAAEEPEAAADLVERFAAALETEGLPVDRGVFGADMQVELVNDGPMTLILEGPPPGDG